MDFIGGSDDSLVALTQKGFSQFLPMKRLQPGDDTPSPDEEPYAKRRKLFTQEDRERVGKNGIFYLFYHLGMRGYDAPDQCHDLWNEQGRAITAAGETGVALL